MYNLSEKPAPETAPIARAHGRDNGHAGKREAEKSCWRRTDMQGGRTDSDRYSDNNDRIGQGFQGGAYGAEFGSTRLSILGGCVAGDAEAQGRFFRRYVTPMVCFLRTLGASDADAQALASNISDKLISGKLLKTFKPDWRQIFGIALTECGVGIEEAQKLANSILEKLVEGSLFKSLFLDVGFKPRSGQEQDARGRSLVP